MTRCQDAAAAPATVLLVAICLQGASVANAELRLHFLAAGRGELTLIELPCGTALVDGGTRAGPADPTSLVHSLERYYAERPHLHGTLDLLITARRPASRTSGITALARRLRVRRIVRVDSRIEARIDGFACERVQPEISVLWGAPGRAPVVRVAYGKGSALLAGDLDATAIGELLARHADTPEQLDVDVYRVGRGATSDPAHRALLHAMAPRMAVVSSPPHCRSASGRARRERAPTRSLVDLLESGVERVRRERRFVPVTTRDHVERMAIDRQIYATGWDGTVVIGIERNGWTRLLETTGAPACRAQAAHAPRTPA